MPRYEITDNISGKTVVIEGASPPSEQEAAQIFSDAGLRSEQPQPNQPQEPSFFGRMNEDLVKRGVNIANELTPTGEESIGQTLLKAPERALRTTGQVAGFGSDVIGNVVSSLIPSGVKTAFKEAASASMTPSSQRFVKGVSEAYNQAEQQYPRTVKNVEALGNIATFFGAGKAGQEASTASSDILKSLTRKPFHILDKELETTVKRGIEKGIRPSVVGNYTAGQSRKYMSNAKDAVESIIANKEKISLIRNGEKVTGVLPESLDDFRNAIEQTKNSVFNQYNSLAKQATGQGVSVSSTPIAKEVAKVAENKVLRDFAPQVAQYAEERSKSLAGKKYSAESAQEAIKIMNQSLESFYAKPSYDTASKAYIDSLIVNKFRSALDDSISNAAGPGYQGLKRTYGALKSIEKDVNRRAIVDARKNVRGLIDFTDVLSGGVAIDGILSMNPARVGQAAAMGVIKGLIKKANNPNRIVKNMFANSEKLLTKMGESALNPKVPKLGALTLSPEVKMVPSKTTPTMEFPMPENKGLLKQYLSDINRRK